MPASRVNSTTALVDAHLTPDLRSYTRELWHRREYMMYVASSELRARQAHTVLGSLWHLLNPALTIGIFYLIFGRLLKVNRGVDNFILFLTIGIFLFQYSQRATMQGASSIVSNSGIIKTIRFPRALLPTTSVLTETIAAVPTLFVIYFVALATGADVRWQWVLLPVLVAFQALLNLALALVAARMTTHFRDTTQILPFAFRIAFYASGVIFNVTAYASGSRALWFDLNPLYCVVTIGRWSVMGSAAEPKHVLSLALWIVLGLAAAFVWFRRAEDRYGRD